MICKYCMSKKRHMIDEESNYYWECQNCEEEELEESEDK